MVFLLLSFLAGVLSVFAACVLPLLPVIVGGSLAAGSRRRTYIIVASLAVSVVAFTLLLKASTALIGIPEELWRYLSGGIIVILGILIIFPKLWVSLPGINLLSRESNKLLGAGYQRGGFWGDALMGAALGPVFASCSPTYFLILATVLPAQPLLGFVYLVAYAAGLSLALLLVAILGERLVARLGVTLDPSGRFFKGIGVLLLVVGILVFTGTMRTIEAWFVERGFDATFIEQRLLGSKDTGAPASAQTSFVSADMKDGLYQKAPELTAIDGYINTSGEPITIGEFKGKKVVLIDIWTYSCINCQRTLPYLKSWYEKYADKGLEIIGVHTPEFAFERVLANVQNAANGFGLTYPIVLDNSYGTWNAFGNQYWPRKYLIDIDGYIVYDHIGEGGYEETEYAIQRALRERDLRLGLVQEMPDTSAPAGVTEVEQRKVGSPETYFGATRNHNLGSGTRGQLGSQTLSIPKSLSANVLYLAGQWTFTDEYATNTKAPAQLRFIYSAKNVYFVASADTPVKIKVTRDGQPLGDARGADVDAEGYLTVQEERLYKVVEDSGYGVHLLEFEIEGSGLEAYTFTFG